MRPEEPEDGGGWSEDARGAVSKRVRLWHVMRKINKRLNAGKQPVEIPQNEWGFIGPKPQQTTPAGETITYTDELGRTVTRFPSGFAYNVEPRITAKPKKKGR